MAVIPIKKPIVVYLISFVYIIGSIAGLMSSLKTGFKIPNAFNLENIETITFSLSLVAGFLLLKPHRFTWTFALIVLVAIFISEAYLFLNQPIGTTINLYNQPLKIFLSTICGATILYFFRFPYLDRRDMWKSTAKRFEVKHPIEIDGHGPHSLGSISLSGARIDLQFPIEVEREMIINLIFPEADAHPIPSRIVDYDGAKRLRVEFKRSPANLKAWMKKKVKQ